MLKTTVLLALLVPLFALADPYDDAVSDPGRSENDRGRDGLRQPAVVLRTIGVEPGATVLDMGAGGGYYSEMLASLVGESGEVYMQNPAVLYELFPTLNDNITGQRLADGRLPNVSLIEAESTAVGLPDSSVDLVFFHLIYHDMFWIYPDQIDAVNAEVARVLKPGGKVVIIDHDSVEGAGNSQTLSRADGLHRLEDAFVEELMTSAGFKLVKSSDALRIPEDDHSLPFFAPEMRGKPTDRFFHIYSR